MVNTLDSTNFVLPICHIANYSIEGVTWYAVAYLQNPAYSFNQNNKTRAINNYFNSLKFKLLFFTSLSKAAGWRLDFWIFLVGSHNWKIFSFKKANKILHLYLKLNLS